MKVTDFQIEQINYKAVKPFIEKWHYSSSVRGLHIEHCFNLTSPDGSFGLPRMIGAMIYGKPAMPDVSKKYCEDNPDIVLELNRLCCIDDTPKNTESFFIGKTLRWLKQNTDIEVILSYADLEQGHEGIIYKASNFHLLGQSGGGRNLMVDGKKYHARSLGQKLKPYGRDLKRRWDNKGGHKFWDSKQDMHFVDTKPKNIYVYYLSKKAKKKYL